MRCLIIANGPPPAVEQVQYEANHTDLIIAADGGTSHALAAGLYPDVVVGDMDSLSPEALDDLREAEVEIFSYATRKNETDLELAIAEAARRGVTSIRIVGAVGDRLDQTLANIFLMTLIVYRDIPMRILTWNEEIFCVREHTTIRGEVGDLVSLIPLTPRVTGVTTRGLEYPLEDAILHFGPTLGISNELRATEAEVSLADGLLLIVHTHQTSPYARPAPPPIEASEPPSEDDKKEPFSQ